MEHNMHIKMVLNAEDKKLSSPGVQSEMQTLLPNQNKQLHLHWKWSHQVSVNYFWSCWTQNLTTKHLIHNQKMATNYSYPANSKGQKKKEKKKITHSFVQLGTSGPWSVAICLSPWNADCHIQRCQ